MALELHYNRFLFTFTLWGSFITHYIEWWLPNYLLYISALGIVAFSITSFTATMTAGMKFFSTKSLMAETSSSV